VSNFASNMCFFKHLSFILALEYGQHKAHGAHREHLSGCLYPCTWNSVYCTDVVLSFHRSTDLGGVIQHICLPLFCSGGHFMPAISCANRLSLHGCRV
jgi:hypothetical protein